MENRHPKGNGEYIYYLNKVRVLNLIREKVQISRSDVVRRTGLSAPTVTRIVDSLINEDNLVEQIGIGESSGGRPPIILRFAGENHFVVGIDWGRTHIYVRLSNLNGKSLVEKDIAIESEDGFENDIARVKELIHSLLNESKIDKNKLRGIGVAAAGFVNVKTGIIEFSPNFNWHNVDICTPLRDEFNVLVIVDNVTRVMAQGELMYGIGSECKDFVFVSIGYGIGAGIIMQGKAFYGFDGITGEIGHNKAVLDRSENRLCTCGKYDCLESYSSGRGIAETAKNLIKYYPHSSLNDVSVLSAETVSMAAMKGDELGLKIMDEAAKLIGVAIASMANNFNPEMVVLGGKVMGHTDFFIKRVKAVFEKERIQQTARNIPLIRSGLGTEAAVKGAVSLILNEVLNLRIE